LLLVDDSDVFRGRLAKALRERGLDVATAANADEALVVLKTRRFDRAVLDLKMPGRSGLALLRLMREHDPSVRVVVLTGFGSIATAVEAMRLGAVNFVSKPADADEVLAAFEVDKVSEGGGEPEMEVQSLARAEWEHIQRVLVCRSLHPDSWVVSRGLELDIQSPRRESESRCAQTVTIVFTFRSGSTGRGSY
jgi:two-component system response regulator RegA